MMKTDPVFEQMQRLLRCPISKGGLRLLNAGELDKLNGEIARGGLFHRDGTQVQVALQMGYISDDGRQVYPIVDGIIILLAHLSIPVGEPEGQAPMALRAEKKILQDFYDQVGWLKGGEDKLEYVDAVKWEDLRPVVSRYTHRCHLRVNRYIPKTGEYLLDAGSGPVQYAEYLTYSEGYRYRICLDISLLALSEARKKLGDKGIYILGDVTNIPLADSVVDGAVSLHTIYHVPDDEQMNAFRELYRAIKPGSSAAVVYSWRNSPLMNVLLFHRRVLRSYRKLVLWAKKIVKKIIGWKTPPAQVTSGKPPENPYHHTFDHPTITRELADLNITLFPWRSVGVPFLKTYIHPKFFGSRILDLVYRFEEKAPRLAARIGQYPIIVLNKK